MMKRFLSGVLAVLLLFSVAACGSKTAEESSAAETQQPEAPSVKVITDALGREVEIPAAVERIVPLGNATRMGVYLGLQDKFVTINQSDLSENVHTAYSWYNRENWASLPIAASGGYGVFHPEVILEANPDLIICTYEADIVASIEEQTGLPVVAVAQGTLFGEDYKDSLRILGEACGVSQRAEAVIAFIDGCLSDLNTRTGDIPVERKPLVLGAAATFRGGHGISGVYVDFPVLQAISANDAAIGLEKESFDTGVEVDKEQILVWDPDVIFLDAGNLGLAETEYAEDPSYFEQLSAVRNGQVYQWPNATSNYTNVEIPLVNAYYAASVLYPEAFADVNFEAKAAEIFGFFLGHDDYLQALTEGGFGYEPYVFGE